MKKKKDENLVEQLNGHLIWIEKEIRKGRK